jgi:hypothetical protein
VAARCTGYFDNDSLDFVLHKSKVFPGFAPSGQSSVPGLFEGEGKQKFLGRLVRAGYPRSIFISNELSVDDALKKIERAGLTFPLVAKPDLRMMGIMFRKIETKETLREHHRTMPVKYLIQEFIDYPIEVSLFYYRLPGQKKGTVIGFLKKEFLQITGDGQSTVLELMLNYSRIRFRLAEMMSRHENRLNDILSKGEIFILSEALNLNLGRGTVSDVNKYGTMLSAIFDKMSHYSEYFCYGIYEIKCKSIDDLKKGRNFYILEFNGYGIGQHRRYTKGYTLMLACKTALNQLHVIFKIARYNKAFGIHYRKYQERRLFFKDVEKHLRTLKHMQASAKVYRSMTTGLQTN